MRAKSMVLILIAGACGLVAATGVSQMMREDGSSDSSVDMAEVYVAMTDVNIGDGLGPENVKLEQWPSDRIPEGAISDLEDLKDQYARQRLYVGEPIMRAKLMNSKAGAESIKIPEGYVAFAVKVAMDTAVSNLVLPGDRVDVMVVLRRGGEVTKTGAYTILQGVRVFSVNQETERIADADGQYISAKTVTLLVKSEQAERLMLAAELGKLSLSLRRPNDATKVAADGADVTELLGLSESDLESQSGPSQASKLASAAGSKFFDFLNEQKEQAPQPRRAPPVQPTQAAKPQPAAFQMTVYSPTGTRKFQWRDKAETPEEVKGTAVGAPPQEFSAVSQQAGEEESNAPIEELSPEIPAGE